MDCPEQIVKIAAGESHLLALSVAGNVYGLGCGEFGQFASLPSCHLQFSKLRLHAPIKCIYASGFSTFLQTEDGSIWACGNNGFGELGTGNEFKSYHPRKISIEKDIIDIKGGLKHTLFL